MDTHRINPRRYDTDTIYCEYHDKDDVLEIKIKNADKMTLELEEGPYRIFNQNNDGVPVAVLIKDPFNEDTEMDTHVFRLGQVFRQWCRINKDIRPEISRALYRFQALQSYDILSKSPDHMRLAIETAQQSLDNLVSGLPEYFEQYRDLKESLDYNYQDSGVTTAAGSMIFETRQRTWVLYETKAQHPALPEYLWGVNHYGPGWTQMPGFLAFSEAVPIPTSRACLQYIFDQQKNIYGHSVVDLNELETKIISFHQMVRILEIIIDIPDDKSAIAQFEKAGFYFDERQDGSPETANQT